MILKILRILLLSITVGKNVEGKTIRKQYEIDFVASRGSMKPRRDEQGIVTMGILNFLMDENSLEA